MGTQVKMHESTFGGNSKWTMRKCRIQLCEISMASRADDYERNKSHSVFRLFQVHMSCSRYGIAKERSGISMTDPRATCRCGYPDTYNPCDKHRGKPSDPAAK